MEDPEKQIALLIANRQHTIYGFAITQGQVSYTFKEMAVVCFYFVIVLEYQSSFVIVLEYQTSFVIVLEYQNSFVTMLEYQTSFAKLGPMGEGEGVLSLYVPAIKVEICYKFG